MIPSFIHSIIIISNTGTTTTTTSIATATSPAFSTSSDMTTGGTESDRPLFSGAIAGGVLAGALLMLLVMLCGLLPVLVRKVRYRRNAAALNTDDVYTLIVTKTTDDELKKENEAYTPTDIPSFTPTNATDKEATCTLNDEHVYAVPDGRPDHQESPELKRNVAYISTNILTMKNAAYLSARENENIPEEYDYVIN